jgi:hypothetical protein
MRLPVPSAMRALRGETKCCGASPAAGASRLPDVDPSVENYLGAAAAAEV